MIKQIIFFPQPKQSEFNLGDYSKSAAPTPSSPSQAAKRDFSNPMYEAMGDMESQAAVEAARAPSAAAAAAPSGIQIGGVTTDASSSDYVMEHPAAVVAPSGGPLATDIPEPAPASGVIKHKELGPSSVDTGKDTQCLVVEEEPEDEEPHSEC